MGALIQLFLRYGFKSRRTLWMALLALLPVGFALLLRLIRPIVEQDTVTLWALFAPLGILLYLNLLLPLTALLVGNAVITDEVEDRTLSYLLTRPVRREWIVVAKLAAAFVTLGLLLALSLLGTYTALVLTEGIGAWWGNLGLMLRTAGVLLLGLAAYLALFALLGGLWRKGLWLGLLFAFGWERMAAFMPGNVKLATILHYLNRLYPLAGPEQPPDLRRLLLGLTPTVEEVSALTALMVLVAVAVVLTAAAAHLPVLREYRLEQQE